MTIDDLTFRDKVNALVREGGYTASEAADLLEDMGEGE